MRRHSPIHAHLSLEELHERFRRCKDANEKTRWQVLFLRLQGKTTTEVAEICGFRPDWVRQLVRRYNAEGPESLRDRRRDNGRERILSDDQLEALREAVLRSTPPSGGLWTGPKVAEWMSDKLKRPVSPQLAWDYLRGHLDFSKQTPRPRHASASDKEQARWKKNSAGA